MARKEWLKDTYNEVNAREFSIRRKEARVILRFEKRKYVYNIIKYVEQYFTLNRIRNMYKSV